MKRNNIVLAGILALTLSVTACKKESSDNVAGVEVNEGVTLPDSMYSFIMSVFPKVAVKETKELGQPNYYGSTHSANLDNNMKIDFDREGNWTEVEMLDNSAIPMEFLQKEIPTILAYVQSNYPNVSIIEVDKDSRRGFEVSLSDNLELVFNQQQEFIGLDLDLDHDEQVVEETEIPKVAKEFIAKNFGETTVVLVKKELDSKEDKYKVYLSNGYKIEFDNMGEWKEIKGNQMNDLPNTVLLERIASYIKANYSRYKTVSIEREKDHFQVEVEKGGENLELLFDNAGVFLGIDD